MRLPKKMIYLRVTKTNSKKKKNNVSKTTWLHLRSRPGLTKNLRSY